MHTHRTHHTPSHAHTNVHMWSVTKSTDCVLCVRVRACVRARVLCVRACVARKKRKERETRKLTVHSGTVAPQIEDIICVHK